MFKSRNEHGLSKYWVITSRGNDRLDIPLKPWFTTFFCWLIYICALTYVYLWLKTPYLVYISDSLACHYLKLRPKWKLSNTGFLCKEIIAFLNLWTLDFTLPRNHFKHRNQHSKTNEKRWQTVQSPGEVEGRALWRGQVQRDSASSSECPE